ncbi:MAG: IMP cyclohydrolase [Hydrogenibacillus schlegelii]|uniref:Bifunctional purine biosynthesis protein PurH n=2 Tax=Hydrogenibacillus schlegelii TaxID=1484 RepID=A0A2T5GCN3_HYDSH|nr:MAG: IMP cyclohydrolase [Hydrogenibacillus schlegelii]
MGRWMIQRAFLSVSDRTGLLALAERLSRRGVELVASSGTAAHLQAAGIPATDVEALTGYPPLLGGRVKTLHPAVHGAILARPDDPVHRAELEGHGIRPFQLVVVNLYPFREALERSRDLAAWVEEIDVGGVALIRAAAKNHAHVLVVVDPADYPAVIEALEGEADEAAWAELRRRFAVKAFRRTAFYDALIARALAHAYGLEALPDVWVAAYERVAALRYGENPHQEAAYYRDPLAGPEALVRFVQHQGKALSYNNIQDAQAALALVRRFEAPAAVAVKHMNPCGAGVGETVEEAFERAYAADPVSIFGGIVAVNRPLSAALADRLKGLFLEVIVAPSAEPEALRILAAKKNVRVLTLPEEGGVRPAAFSRTALDRFGALVPEAVTTSGGLLVQTPDAGDDDPAAFRVVTRRAPTEAEWRALRFAWEVVRFVKSNAIVLAREGMTVGIGAGQMSRVGAVKIAVQAAGERARGAVMASDAFFPMPDSIEVAAAAGVTAVIHPGGSIRDDEVIAAADRAGMAMVVTGVRHFRH